MNLSKHISSKKGFTLIELLIVIGILGILAVGLLAAFDPAEQLRRGRDSTKKNLARQIADASARYMVNSANGLPPWDNTLPVGAMAEAALTGATQTAGITALITSGDLKANFTQAASAYLGSIFWAGDVSSNSAVCFIPESRAERVVANLDADNDMVVEACAAANCPATGTCTCYLCVR